MIDESAIDQVFAEQFGTSEEEKLFLKEMMLSARSGHLCLSRKEEFSADFIETVDHQSKWFGKVVGKWGDLYYLQRNWILETHIVDALKRLLDRDVKPLDFTPSKHLNFKQRSACKTAFRESVMCLSGGPGTGKTYILGEIVKQYVQKGEGQVVLAAPTGKAVGRLKEQMNETSTLVGTLHALLKVKKDSGALWSGKNLDGGLLIVDECSMIDVKMWAALLSAVQAKMRLILVGDHNQLPPVEAGTVFGDICRYLEGGKHYVHLDRCMRVEREEMVKAAELVQKGKFPDALLKDTFNIEKWAKRFPGPQKGTPNLEKLFKELTHFKVLSSLRKGPWGVEIINEKIFACLRQRFVKGDVWPIPILVTKTDYTREIFNGDIGLLIKTSSAPFLEKNDLVFFEKGGSFFSFPALLLLGFEKAYALSVHKSQGSEYDDVIFVVPKGSEKFGREVLYTGMTRARKSIEIVGDRQVIECSLKHSGKKRSGILKRLHR